MKLHKYIIGLALLVSSSSCNFLDEEAYEFITPDNFYKTEADANAALTAVYNTFADEKSYRRYIWMGADFPGEAANANASAPSRVHRPLIFVKTFGKYPILPFGVQTIYY